MTSDSNSDNSDRISIGRIPLKQVRVKKPESTSSNPMNRLVPYLDLFVRLEDDELARLAGCDEETVSTLRKQVVVIGRALSRYVDLLPRLSDEELIRLTGATPKTIRFWRLCQPRVPVPAEPDTIVDDAVEVRTLPPSAAAPQRAEPSPSDSLTRGVRPSESERFGTTPAEDRGAQAPIAHPTPQPSPSPTPTPAAAAAQVSAARFMQFSGEPFPGFEDEGSPTRIAPTWEEPEEVEIEELTDDLLDDPNQGF